MFPKHLVALSLAVLLLISCSGNNAPETTTIPSGTTVQISLKQPLSTETNQPGDRFEGETLEPIMVANETVIPAGTIVYGRLVDLDKPGNVEGRAAMSLAFNEISGPGNERYSFETAPVKLQADSGTRGDVEKIAAGALAGAVLGGLTKGKEGAAVGAVLGAGAGGAIVVATKGDHISLSAGQKLLVELTESTEYPVSADNQ
jgi:hypothetical protein